MYSAAIQENAYARQLAERAWGPNHPLIYHALLDEACWSRKLHHNREAKILETRAREIQKAIAGNSYARYTVDARDLAMSRPPASSH
jgi:hypothetical protein